MMNRMFVRSGLAAMAALLTLLSATFSWALTPTVIWQAAGGYPGGFSADGSSVFISTSSGFVSTGFQMRRATDGLVQKTITLPASSQLYDRAAFSPDKQFVAITIVDPNSGAIRIELWSLSTGSLIRTITTDAVRNVRGLDISSNSAFIASMERTSYGGGGMLRVFRGSDGALVSKQGPFVTNSNTFVKFSPGGAWLALYQNTGLAGFDILRTSNWTVAQQMTQGNQYMIQWLGTDTTASVWLRGNSTLSIPYRQIAVTAGTVQHTLTFDDSTRSVSAVTANGKYFLTYLVANSDPSAPLANTIYFLRSSDGGAQTTYNFSSTVVSSNAINPAGTNFLYGICGDTGACTTYVAQMPSLP